MITAASSPGFAEIRRWLAWLRPRLSSRRFRHCLDCHRAAQGLARRYGISVPPRPLAQACLLHDCAKELDGAAMAELLGPSCPEGDFDTGLWHGVAGARALEVELGIGDEQVLFAVANHNTGCGASTPLLELLVVADYIEPGRDFASGRRLDLERFEGFDELLVEVQRRKLIWCLETGRALAARSVEAWNEWLERKGRL